MIRSMHLTEYSVDNMHINFRYGMFNPEYPNRLVKNNFALDYDCFVQEAITSPAEVTSYIERGHRFIQALFEASITDALRKEMKNE